MNRIIDFFIKKRVQTATGEMSQTSKTKIFITIEGVLRLIEFLSPHFGHPIEVPDHIHKLIYTLAGLSYAERAMVPAKADKVGEKADKT